MTGELKALWLSTKAALPTGYELASISYQGPDHLAPWIATGEREAVDGTKWCEGAGANADEAANDLLAHIASEHQP